MAEHMRGHSRFALAIQAFLILVALDVGFRLFGFRRVYRFVQWWGARSPSAADLPNPSRVVENTRESVRIATRYYWRRRLDCLPRSLTLHLLLRRGGLLSTLHIGVKRYPFGAHAWVECLGEVLDDTPNSWRHEPYVPIIST